MLAASWSAGACPAERLLDAWALPGSADSPWCSPNTAPTPVSRIAVSPTIRIRSRIVMTSLDGQPGGTGTMAGVPPGSCVLELGRRLVWAAGGGRWRRVLRRARSGRPAPAHQPSGDQQGGEGDGDRSQGGGDDRVHGVVVRGVRDRRGADALLSRRGRTRRREGGGGRLGEVASARAVVHRAHVGQGDVRERRAEGAVVRVDAVTGRQRAYQLAGLRRALQRLQLDVDHVVGEPAAVREALQVAAEHAEPVWLRGG